MNEFMKGVENHHNLKTKVQMEKPLVSLESRHWNTIWTSLYNDSMNLPFSILVIFATRFYLVTSNAIFGLEGKFFKTVPNEGA